MKGQHARLPQLSLCTLWILSTCLYFGNCQPRNELMDLNNRINSLGRNFDGFRAYVEKQLSMLREQNSMCCGGGFGGGADSRPVDLQITKTRVEVPRGGDTVTYSIEYSAIREPKAIWRINSEPATISDEGIITKFFRNGAGKTTLRIDSSKEIVASIIVDHVTFVVTFRANPTKTAEMVLRPTNFYVDTGNGGFNYVKGKPLQIMVSSPKFYTGFNSANEYKWSFWMANMTARPPIMEEYPQFTEINGAFIRIGPIRTLRRVQHPRDLKIIYELMTDKGDYDGILIFSKHYTAMDSASVITGLTEMRYVFVNRQDRNDPFPNGFVSFVRRDPTYKPCVYNQTCSIACHAVGVIPQGIQLFRLQRDNTLLELKLPKLEVREPYMLYAHFAIKSMVEEDEGDYICSTWSRDSRSEIRTTLLISEPVVFDNATSGLVWGSDTATITCAVKGRPLPKLRLFENYAWQNEFAQTMQDYRLDRTVDRLPGGEYVATAVLTIRLSANHQTWRVICIAENQFELKATDFKLKERPQQSPGQGSWRGPPGPNMQGPPPPNYNRGPPPPNNMNGPPPPNMNRGPPNRGPPPPNMPRGIPPPNGPMRQIGK